MWQTFDAEQDDDLVRALARQELQNRQGLGIAKAFGDQQADRERTAINRDTLEMNRESRAESSDIRRQRAETEAADRQSRIDERNLNESERLAALKEADRVLADPRADPDMKRAANAVKLRLKPSVSIADNAVTRVPIMRVGRGGSVEQIGETDSNAKIVNEPAPPSASSRGELSAYQRSMLARGLRKDYVTSVKEFSTVKMQRDKMQTALDRWKSGAAEFRDAAGQTILVSFQKTLDPDSVVRETEYARSEQGQPLFDRIKAKWQQMVSGGPTVSDQALAEYVSMVDEFYKLAERNARETYDAVALQAEDAGIQMDRIAAGGRPGGTMPGETAQPPAPAAPAAGAAPAPSKFKLRPKV
jgi:hypothetical protein